MSKVHRLDENTINKIAAGEVVERPASAVKELVENSIDSGATKIEIEIKSGGRQLIRITDNGCGMEREEAILALERHTTSKISEAEDLWDLHTLGFRGEALPSIAAVSRFEMFTKTETAECGSFLEVNGGILKKVKDTATTTGTTIKVQDLFFNIPARLKYLKSIPTESGYISDIVSRLALGYPQISFKLQHHEYELLFTPGNGSLDEAIIATYSKEIYRELIPINYQQHGIKVTGFIGKPTIARNNRNHETFFINHRYFHSRNLNVAVEKGYHTLLPVARFPFFIIFLEVEPGLVDINAHPNKLEVRFSNESELFKAVFNAVRTSLKEHNLIAEWAATESPEIPSQISLTKPSITLKPITPKILPPTNLKFNYAAETQEQTAALRESFAVKESTADFSTQNTLTVPKLPPETVTPEPTPFVARINSEPFAKPDKEQTEPEKTETVSTLSTKNDFYVYPEAVENTYLIIKDQDGLLFIDQHAAHERVLYEKYMRQGAEFLGSQALLFPETVTLTYAQYKAVADRLSLFGKLGFELEDFGGQTIIIRAVPISTHQLNPSALILELIEQYLNFETFKDPAEIQEAFIITMSCRTAIKAGDRLEQLEIEELVKDLFKCENPYTCPHGRPTIFRIRTEELAKKFLRRSSK